MSTAWISTRPASGSSTRRKAPIAQITLNWPEKANAQDQKLAEEVDAALLDADRDYDIKVLILKANGKGFCSGHAIGDNATDYPAFVEGAMVPGTRGRRSPICSSSRR